MKLIGRRKRIGNREVERELDDLARVINKGNGSSGVGTTKMLNNGEAFVDQWALVGRDGDGLVALATAEIPPRSLSREAAASGESFEYAVNANDVRVIVEDPSATLPPIGTIGWGSHFVPGAVTFTAPLSETNQRIKVGLLVGTSVADDGSIEFDLAIDGGGITNV